MIDLHNHMLPGLDDGAVDWEESLAMARLAVRDGIRGVVCTPHWLRGAYETSRSVVLEKAALLREKLQDRKIPLEIYPGSELRLDTALLNKIKSREILTLNDNGRYALLELPPVVISEHVERFLWELCSQGITPILGHPERNFFLQRQPTKLANWIKRGALVQITGASLLGHFGRSAQEFAQLLIEHHMVHVLATDAHGMQNRPPVLSAAHHLAEQIMGKEYAARLVCETPKCIVQGVPVPTEAPLPLDNRASVWRKLVSFWK
ncbi:MAG: CpsB/CapC family capsule biosynthesis tyrosine phosphatase [Desulforhabdus sp.]|jgi:protein-tyrosine phosphatase|nr:CpsB/CapC family capsule biosynthesis tyrosine phosphatase [Desulforhabdus sp.]